jgi:AcrR family transcriptional regulator
MVVRANSAVSGPDKVRKRGRPADMFPVVARRVVGVATRLFAEKGYDSTSIADICEAAGIGKGALYHYIDSKEDLLIAVFDAYTIPVLKLVQDAAVSPGTYVERLERVSRCLVHAIVSYPDEVRVIEREWSLVTSGGERWRPVARRMRAFDSLMADLLTQGVAAGEITVENVEVAVLVFWGMHNYMSRWYKAGGRLTEQEIADEFSRIYLFGVAATQAPA